jgi:DNA-binding transcriptional regulator GbsR (MarR family)
MPELSTPRFDGQTYIHKFDHNRLTGQLSDVYAVMADGRWRTLDEINGETGHTHQSISARLRDLRKEKFGSYTVSRRRRGDPKHGVHEYRVEQE